MGMRVMMMMRMRVSRRTDRVSSITACTHVFEALEAVVRVRLAMQLKLELLGVLRFLRGHSLKRPGGAVRALWRGPSKIFRRRGSSALANGAPDGELGATPLPTRRRAEPVVMTAPVASLALGTRVD